ncbi:MAG: DUF805 domain-containing protein [Alphaproteobacteria bacterium]|nr:DUF805 domain-containing protein [Alphaproteobacteria bacterium]MBU1280640.1 DUF805 domain-containing protein [Alphaproteobacteria bacterium]MBU1828820.1 DUF805 domain-containing protein [Alphaproteobacteria bacterium]MBU2078801.1 DUF805 domain-containing protein [Alphaproteobacteria bacterium]MBU2160154.1 DUF805 domain-containing protein [Alphaproteobacteria bacterium]
MTFLTAIKTCFSKYITLQGRARRAEYWWWVLFTIIAGIILGGVDMIFFGVPELTGPTSGLFSLATLLPGLAVWVRRLHDVNRSGWWVFLILIPLIGWLVLVIWAVTKGTSGPNRFGPDPITGEEAPLSYTDSAIPPVNRGE